jgi:hypothetical protein
MPLFFLLDYSWATEPALVNRARWRDLDPAGVDPGRGVTLGPLSLWNTRVGGQKPPLGDTPPYPTPSPMAWETELDPYPPTPLPPCIFIP